MAGKDTVEITDQNFQQEVMESSVPVLIDFWAVWCGPCRAIAPAVEELATQYKGKVKFGKMDVDAHSEIPRKYGIMSIPTLLVFKDGKVVDQVVGAVPKNKIEQMVQRAL